MKTRVITSVVGILVLALVLLFFDTVFFNIVIFAVCMIAVFEIYKAFHFENRSLYILIGFIPVVFLVMVSDYLPFRLWLLPIFYLFALFISVCVILNVHSVNFAKLSGMAVFSAIVVLCFYSLVDLKSVLPRETYGYDAVYFLLLTLGFAWGGDTCAYFAGRAFGKHKLAPVVSPNKTVEGAIGGVLGSVLVGEVFTVIYVLGFNQSSPFTIKIGYYFAIALLGAVASVLGICGDLFASAVKRQNEIKDYGSIFPGHGGILDRFDSVMFIAPLVALAVRYAFYHFQR